MRAAQRSGEIVEAGGVRTEHSRTYARPDGTLVRTEHLRPQWIRQDGGDWTPVDPTLRRRSDGSISPTASTLDVTFSGGGADDAFASMRAGDGSVALHWPGDLPEPAVDGNTATYPNVLPGVDLQVRADVDAFTHLLVIRSPKAADNPELDQIEFGADLDGAALEVDEQTGQVSVVDGAGEVVIDGPTPVMWDSRGAVDPAGEQPEDPGRGGVRAEEGKTPGSPAGPPDGAIEPRQAKVTAAVSSGKLTLTPDAEMLADPATVYPVYIDPTWTKTSGTRHSWTVLRQSHPSTSYYKASSISNGDGTYGVMRAGFNDFDGPTYRDRSLFAMDISRVKYKRINRAVFSLTQQWTGAYCGNNSPVRRTHLREVQSFGSSTTWNWAWNTSGSGWKSTLATSDAIRRYGNSCGPKKIEFNIASRVQQLSNAGTGMIYLGLRAANENDKYSWKRYKNDAALAIEYNTRPNAPTDLKVAGKTCVSGSGRPYVTTPTPAFSARVSDPDGGQQSLRTRFYWWKNGQSRADNDYREGTSANPATVNTASIPAGKQLQDSQIYTVQAHIWDDVGDGRWSGQCEFMADLVPPNPPAGAASTAYPVYDPGDPGDPGTGGVGIPGSISINPPSVGAADVTAYAYTLDGGIQPASAPRVAAGSGGTATVTVTPVRDGLNTLRVWATDRAGWFSSEVTYQFKVASGNGPAAQWTFDTAGTPGADDTGHGNDLTFSGTATTTGRAGTGTALSITSAPAHAYRAGGVQTPHPQTGVPLTVRTDSTFTVTAWARLDSTAGPDHQAVVGMDSTNSSPFAISHIPGSNTWRFAMADHDTTTTSLATVHSTVTATAGRWTHLAGVYDIATKQLRLYVDGVLQPNTATLTAGFHGTGSWTLGRRRYGGIDDSYFKGAIDDVRVYNYAVTASDLEQLARPLPPQVTFPDGPTATVGDQVQVRFDAGGDVNVTEFWYSVGNDTLDLSTTPTSPGGVATVNVTAASTGELRVFAAGRNTATGVDGPSSSAAIEVLGTAAISGRIIDSLAAPVPDAQVVLEPAGLTTTSDANGAYSFTGLAPGDYVIAAYHGGGCGQAASDEVTISNAMLLDLVLTARTDGFGHGCVVVDQPFIPANDTVLNLTGDDSVATVSLPFDVNFYGDTYQSAWVDTNGIMTFVDPAGSHPGNSVNIPAPAEPNAMIAAFWDDLVVDGSASVWTATVGAAPFRQFVVEWRDVHRVNEPTQRLSVQVVLDELGLISLNYDGIDPANPAEQGGFATVGIESPGGAVGLEYSFSTPVLADDQAVVFLPPLLANPIQTFDLAGTVTDAGTGNPDPGAVVTLEPAGISVTADPAGNYEFTEIEGGTYTVSAESGSNCGRLLDVEVDLHEQTEIDLPLQPLTDAVGNTCQLEQVTFVPADGTVLPLTGDDGRTQVTVPFPISFYGNSYTTIWVDIDGVASFQNFGGVPWQSTPLPSADGWNEPNGAIYPFWDDWVVDSAASVRTETHGSAPNRQYVIEWRNVHSLDEPTVRVSFELIFHEAGDIVVAWDGIGGAARAQGSHGAVAIENTDGSVALVHSFHESVLQSGQGVRFTMGPPPVGDVDGTVSCAGVPVSGATVTVAGQTTTTGPDGGYSFTGLSGGPYTALATPAGGACYGTAAEPATVFGNDTTTVDLVRQPSSGTRYQLSDGPRSYIPANGTVLPLTGDDGIHEMTPPFPISLYGQQFSTAWVQNDGVVSFQEPDGHAWDPNPIPQPSAVGRPDAAVYPFWHDWVVDSAASVRTETLGAAPNRRWVVEWRDVVSLVDPAARVSFAAVFHENGDIEIVWDGIDVNFYEQGGYATTGIENAGGTVAAQYSYHHPVITSGHGILFQPVTS